MKKIYLSQENIYGGNLILVNGEHKVCGPGEEKLISVGKTGVLLKRQAGLLLWELLKKIGAAEQIVLVSGWRSHKEQQKIWEDSIAENGLEFTKKFVAVPGHSEHETGLAIDLGLKKEEIDFICPEFPYEGICDKFRTYAADYGFIERYPAGKEMITGIGHEPWHFRYVGVPHAMILKEEGLTLEEYVDFLQAYSYEKPYRYEENGLEAVVFWQEARKGKETLVSLPEEFPCWISGDNVEGFIITEWRGVHGSKKELRRA